MAPRVPWSSRGAPNPPQREVVEAPESDRIARAKALSGFASKQNVRAVEADVIDLTQKDDEARRKAPQAIFLAQKQLPGVYHASSEPFARKRLGVHEGNLCGRRFSEDEEVDVALLRDYLVGIPLGTKPVADDEQVLAHPHKSYGTFKPSADALIQPSLREGVERLLRNSAETF